MDRYIVLLQWVHICGVMGTDITDERLGFNMGYLLAFQVSLNPEIFGTQLAGEVFFSV